MFWFIAGPLGGFFLGLFTLFPFGFFSILSLG